VSVEVLPRQGELVPTQDLTPPQLLQIAIARGVDTEQLSKLMELQREWKADQAREAYTTAITAFKSEPLRLTKTKQVSFNTTHYKHATLADVVGAVVVGLSKHGLSHRWETKQEGNVITVTCVITHQMGHSERTTLSASADQSGGKNAIQAVGSAVTYLQRYTLMAATGLAASDTDDDGQAAAQVKRITESQAADLDALIEEVGARRDKFLQFYKITKLDELPAADLASAVSELNRKRK
jgi:hypothetical protein